MREEIKAALFRIESLIWRTRAYKRFFFDDMNQVKVEAIPFMKWLKHFCHMDRAVYKLKPDGSIDPYATHIAAGRQEVYQELMRLLALDEKQLNEQLNRVRMEDYNP